MILVSDIIFKILIITHLSLKIIISALTVQTAQKPCYRIEMQRFQVYLTHTGLSFLCIIGKYYCKTLVKYSINFKCITKESRRIETGFEKNQFWSSSVRKNDCKVIREHLGTILINICFVAMVQNVTIHFLSKENRHLLVVTKQIF